jgi:diguanylate cyclase (GGDEF)-like protein/PAS domain S-box-containing protein
MKKEAISILVVDDTETTRNLLAGVLTERGYTVTTAASGGKALRMISAEKYNLVLLDILMPDIDGLTVLKTIRQQYSSSVLPVIVVTVKYESGDIVTALALGANDYVSKPIDFPVLFARIQNVLSRQCIEDDLRKTNAELETRVEIRTAELHHLNEGLKIEIEQRKEIEKALRRSESRYRDLYNQLPSMFFTVDRTGKILLVNEYGAKQLGYSVEELRGKPLSMLFEPNIQAAAGHFFETCFEHEDTVHHWENRKLTKEGAVLWVRDTARFAFDASGKPSLFIICEDITEARLLSEKLSYQASHDDLTGLVNRREFNNRLQRILDTAKTDGSEHALCYLDLDKFKIINDTCGHTAGDDLLRQLGNLLQSQARKRDTLARLGGDEFGILMEHCSLEQARRLANAVRKIIKNFGFIWEDQQFTIGVSIGLVLITENSESISNILRDADAACYIAKEMGRNRIHEHRDSDSTILRKQSEKKWGLNIDRSLQEKRFELYCQPIDTLNHNVDSGGYYEFLLRMKTPQGDLVNPAAFLPTAVRLNRSSKLDRWVISTLFKWLQRNQNQLKDLTLCSINLSAHSMAEREFLDFVIEQFATSGISPTKICFEITETATTTNFLVSKQLILSLKKLGCIFAVDDFGNSLSSFNFVKSLPFDYLKIDAELSKNILANEINLAMAKSIIEISHVMGKKTIAKGIENKSTLDKMKVIGIDYAQGYYLGRPQPLNRLLLVK